MTQKAESVTPGCTVPELSKQTRLNVDKISKVSAYIFVGNIAADITFCYGISLFPSFLLCLGTHFVILKRLLGVYSSVVLAHFSYPVIVRWMVSVSWADHNGVAQQYYFVGVPVLRVELD